MLESGYVTYSMMKTNILLKCFSRSLARSSFGWPTTSSCSSAIMARTLAGRWTTWSDWNRYLNGVRGWEKSGSF